MLRGLIFKYLINEASAARQSMADPVVQRLYAQLRKAVEAATAAPGGASLMTRDGLPGFMLRCAPHATLHPGRHAAAASSVRRHRWVRDVRGCMHLAGTCTTSSLAWT